MFLNTLIKNLFENNYQLFYSESKDITPYSTCFGFIKQVGATAYIPVIINTDIVTDYNQKFQYICSSLSEEELKTSFTNIIFTGIFFSTGSKELKDYCSNNTVDFGENINYIKWYVNTTNQTITCGKNQPDKIDTIHTCINSALKNQALEIDDIATAYTKAKEKSAEKIKSHNIFMTISLIVINFVIILTMEIMGGSKDTQTLLSFGAIEPVLVFNQKEYYRLFTHMFLHIGWTHFLSNSLSLYIFGSRVEQYYGKIRFIIIYILSGIIGGIFAVSFEGFAVSAGASGAIFGLMGAVFNYIWTNKTNMAGFDKYIIAMFAILSIGSGFVIGGVSNFAHIGGFIGGFITAFIMNRICTH